VSPQSNASTAGFAVVKSGMSGFTAGSLYKMVGSDSCAPVPFPYNYLNLPKFIRSIRSFYGQQYKWLGLARKFDQ
jgi:hypothetical protein